MRRRGKLLTAMAVLLCCTMAAAQSDKRDAPLDADTLHEWLMSPNESFVLPALVYIESVRMAYAFLGPALAKGTDKQMRDIPCIPRQVTNAQVNDAVRTYLQTDAGWRGQPAFLISSKALAKAWPCTAK